MKYISRLMALLLVAVMGASSASALTTDGLTQGQMDALYTAVANSVTEMDVTDVLGATGEFSSEEAANWAAQGFPLQWYSVDAANETRTEITGQTTSSLEVSYTLEEQRFICVATDEVNQLEYKTPVYVVVAETTDMDVYLNTLYTEYYNLYDYLIYDEPDTTLDAYKAAAYKWMQTWNVELEDNTNLADNVLTYWFSDMYPEKLLCSCGGENDGLCILDPDATHAEDCRWSASTFAEDVYEPESLVDVQKVVLTALVANADSYAWEIYDAQTQTWTAISGATGFSYTVTADVTGIQSAYRVVSTIDGVASTSEPFYLGGEEFFNWVTSTQTLSDGTTTVVIGEWLSTEGMTLEYAVAAFDAYTAGIPLDEAIYLDADATEPALLELLGLSTLATYDPDTGLLTDTRYHIAVAQVDADGNIVPLETTDTTTTN